MIDLYGLTSPNVQKIYIMLEELGLPYRENFVDVWKSEQYSPEFAKINPNCKIPAIVDHEGPGGRPYTVFEGPFGGKGLGDGTAENPALFSLPEEVCPDCFARAARRCRSEAIDAQPRMPSFSIRAP